jgi:nicotinamide mononucleotide adenylyltransferase
MKKAIRWAGVVLIIIGVAHGRATAEEAGMGTSNGERVEAISLVFKSYCMVKDEERVAETVKFLENLRISSYAFPNAEAEKGFYRDIANKRLWLWV